MSAAALGANPIHCLQCNLEVPPERLQLTPRDVEAVADWHRTYGAIEYLELASGPYEGWARTQLLDPASPPNVDGLGLAKSINRYRRCYLWFFQPDSDDDFQARSTCPVCEGPLIAYDGGIFAQLLCEKDNVVLVGHESWHGG
jgi:hypothetical protein